jgi:hypothetical protein
VILQKPNIIFIDIDGPLIPERWWLHPANVDILAEVKGRISDIRINWELKKRVKFDPVAVWMFNALAKYSNALGVLSTNWMNHTTIEQMQELFVLNGLNITLHDHPVTPKKMSSYRSNEIMWWLDKYQQDINDYIIIDDDWSMNPKHMQTVGDDFAAVGARVIYVDGENGMTRENFNDACRLFKIDFDELNMNEFGHNGR